MTPLLRTGLITAALMFGAPVFAWLLSPQKFVAEFAPKAALEEVIPKHFGEWSIVSNMTPVIVAPDVQAQLDVYYDQTLSRTYINRSGQRVMLSIAYGTQQTRTLQVHRPDICYAAQGFSVRSMGLAEIKHDSAPVRMSRLLARSGTRNEPITYWIRIGDETVYGGLPQFLKRLEFGLQGYVTDGMLVRVSSLNDDAASAFAIQDSYIHALLNALDSTTRKSLIGS